MGFREALITLRNSQKTSKGAPAYSLLVNRRLGALSLPVPMYSA